MNKLTTYFTSCWTLLENVWHGVSSFCRGFGSQSKQWIAHVQSAQQAVIRRGTGKGRKAHNGWLEKQTRNGKRTKYDKTDRWWTQYRSQFYTIKLIFLTVKDNCLVSMLLTRCVYAVHFDYCHSLLQWYGRLCWGIIPHLQTSLLDHPCLLTWTWSIFSLFDAVIVFIKRRKIEDLKKCVILYAKWLGVWCT